MQHISPCNGQQCPFTYTTALNYHAINVHSFALSMQSLQELCSKNSFNGYGLYSIELSCWHHAANLLQTFFVKNMRCVTNIDPWVREAAIYLGFPFNISTMPHCPLSVSGASCLFTFSSITAQVMQAHMGRGIHSLKHLRNASVPMTKSIFQLSFHFLAAGSDIVWGTTLWAVRSSFLIFSSIFFACLMSAGWPHLSVSNGTILKCWSTSVIKIESKSVPIIPTPSSTQHCSPKTLVW